MPTHAIRRGQWTTTAPAAPNDFLSGLFGWRFAPFGETCFITAPAALNVSRGANTNDRARNGGGPPSVHTGAASIEKPFTWAGGHGRQTTNDR